MKKKLFTIFICLVIIILPIKLDSKKSSKASTNISNVIVFAYFDDADIEYFSNLTNDILDAYDGSTDRSFTNYMKRISYDKVNVKNIFPQLENNQIKAFKVEGVNVVSGYDHNIDENIIDQIVRKVPATSGVNLDYDNDGFIDNLTIILKGTDGYEAVSESTFVSHKQFSPSQSNYSGKIIGNYNVVSDKSLKDSYGYIRTEVLAHEFLHTLGFSDLYSKSGNQNVYIWDIMSVALTNYPLAYLRSVVGGWLDIDTITESTNNLTLNLQNNPDGNQAFVLKSPFNEYELFVVEYRKKMPIGSNQLDINIGTDGVLVYRVDTTVPGYSNMYGSTGVYVFRKPLTDNAITNVYNAPLKEGENIGSTDLNAGINDGALTYKDGTNSGIVIKNVRLSSDKAMIDVTIPNQADYDLWLNTNIPVNNEENRSLAITNYQNQIFGVEVSNYNIYTYIYENNTWTLKNTTAFNSINPGLELKLVSYNNELYMIGSLLSGNLFINKWNNNKWLNIINSNILVSYLDVLVKDNTMYLNISDGTSAGLYTLNNTNLNLVTNYYNDINGNVVLTLMDNELYLGVKTINGKIKIYQYQNNNCSLIKTLADSDSISSFDLKSYNNNLYVVYDTFSNSKLKIYKYQNNDFALLNSELSLSEPKIISLDKMYILGVKDNNLVLYLYDETLNNFTITGSNIDNNCSSYQTTNALLDNELFIALKRSGDNGLLVKKKAITTPTKTVKLASNIKTEYFVGDSFDANLVKVLVTINGVTKEVTNYQLIGFKTDTPGNYTGTIQYEDSLLTYTYKVVAKNNDNQNDNNNNNNNNTNNNPPIENYLTFRELATPNNYYVDNYVHGFRLDTKISTLNSEFKNLVTINSSKDIITTGTTFSYRGETYIAVIYGDLNGDGKINSADLLVMRQYLLGTNKLAGANLEAAHTTRNNAINSANLLKLRQHLLETSKIEQ